MKQRFHAFLAALASISLSVILLAGCNKGSSGDGSSPSSPGAASGPSSAGSSPGTSTAVKKSNDDTIPSGTGTEKQKPAAGKGNVQGKVFYNGKPASGIEVKLAEKFNRFLGEPTGEVLVTKTDAAGEYLIKDVTPRLYEGLLVKVFDAPYYQFATAGFVGSAKYKIEPDHTYFAPDTNLFKGDLKLLSPKAASKVGPSKIEIKWAPYPDAAYYKFSVNADSQTGAKTEYDYINKRVDGVSYVLDKPLTPGTYSCTVSAYNAGDVKLSESASDIKFTVK
jgi:hypothetical protein